MAAAPLGSYKIIFDGTGTGHQDRPNNGQSYKSQDATATWHIEYALGGNNTGAPDLSTSTVTGTGSSAQYGGTGNDCTSTAAKFVPNPSRLRAEGGGTFMVTAPLAGDLISAGGCDASTGATDPFLRAFGAWCAAASASGTTTTIAPIDCQSQL